MRVKYVTERNGSFYFEPSQKMRDHGFRPEALGKDSVAAYARAKTLNDDWKAVQDGLKAKPDAIVKGTLKWLIREYQNKSAWYAKLEPPTKAEYDRHLQRALASPMAHHPVRSIQRADVRIFYDKTFADATPWVAHDAHKVLSRLLSYGVELGLMPTNPAAKMEIAEPDRRKVTWQPEQVDKFIAMALAENRLGWALAASIGYDSGQDLTVILHRLWTHYDGEGMDFRRTKTDVESWSPMRETTRGLLEIAPRSSVRIITTSTGRPINSRSYFGRVFRELRDKAGLPKGLRFRDLRRTVGTEIDAGGGNPESVLGLTPGSPVKKHYVVPSKDAARTAQASRKREQKG